MSITFAPAERIAIKARVLIEGPAGSAKSATALRLARGLVGPEGRIAAVDTERRSLRKYAGLYGGAFDVVELEDFHPLRFIEAIETATKGSYDALVVDSLSHSWMGIGGTLSQVDEKKKSVKNDFMAWAEPSKHHGLMIEAILQAPIHIIATMRSKMAYELQDVGGKKVPVKLGLQPIHREGVEYEFDVIGTADVEHVVRFTKARANCPLEGMVVKKPDERIGELLRAWCDNGVAPGELPQSFEIGGKRYYTAGVTKETLVALWAVRRANPATLGLEALEELSESAAQELLANHRKATA